MKKIIPNIITFLRLVFSTAMIFTETFSIPFMVLYSAAGVSDMIDGYVARKLDACTEFGAVLDSVSDVVFCGVALFKVLLAVVLPEWLLWIMGGIALVKALNVIFGFIKQKKLVLLHTVPNKITGFLVFVVPYLLCFVNSYYVFIPLCLFALFAAVHEGTCILLNSDEK